MYESCSSVCLTLNFIVKLVGLKSCWSHYNQVTDCPAFHFEWPWGFWEKQVLFSSKRDSSQLERHFKGNLGVRVGIKWKLNMGTQTEECSSSPYFMSLPSRVTWKLFQSTIMKDVSIPLLPPRGAKIVEAARRKREWRYLSPSRSLLSKQHSPLLCLHSADSLDFMVVSLSIWFWGTKYLELVESWMNLFINL